MDERRIPVPGWSTAITQVGFHKILVRGYPLEELIRNLSFPEVVFLTIRGELPTKEQARVLDAALCAIVDHGFFAPTIVAARVVASANPQSIVPAMASGILTVGSVTVSPQETAELILEASKLMREEGLSMEETARRVLEELRSKGRRIPGLGHPLHPDEDPRASALKEVAVKNGLWGQSSMLYEEIHKAFVEISGRFLPINIDGMLGCVLTELGFEPKEMAGIAAISFMPGIIAHAVEESRDIKLRVVEGDYTGVSERHLPPDFIRR